MVHFLCLVDFIRRMSRTVPPKDSPYFGTRLAEHWCSKKGLTPALRLALFVLGFMYSRLELPSRKLRGCLLMNPNVKASRKLTACLQSIYSHFPVTDQEGFGG